MDLLLDDELIAVEVEFEFDELPLVTVVAADDTLADVPIVEDVDELPLRVRLFGL